MFCGQASYLSTPGKGPRRPKRRAGLPNVVARRRSLHKQVLDGLSHGGLWLSVSSNLSSSLDHTSLRGHHPDSYRGRLMESALMLF